MGDSIIERDKIMGDELTWFYCNMYPAVYARFFITIKSK